MRRTIFETEHDDFREAVRGFLRKEAVPRTEAWEAAGIIDRVDRDDSTVYVDRSKDEIKGAPEFDEERYREAAYRDELSRYYSR